MPFSEGDKLHIPFPTWSEDDRDHENWKEVERWAHRMERVPLIFHWHGTVSTYVDLRNGPGEFGGNGIIPKIRYRWDPTALPTTDATVAWYFDSTLMGTHTLPASTTPHIERPNFIYAQEAITAIVTADGGGSGLTAFMYYR